MAERYVCTGCGVEYGATEGKKMRGFCHGCWGLFLEQQRLNVRVAYVRRCKELGIAPRWDFNAVTPQPEE